MPTQRSLSEKSGAWRWWLALTMLLTGAALFANPWRHHYSVAQGNATYSDPSAPHSNSLPLSRVRTASQVNASATGSRSVNPAFDAQVEVNRTPLPAGTEIHMIGVYEGEAPTGTQNKPWWANCTSARDDSRAMAECHGKYATKHIMHDVEVNIARGNGPMVLVLSAYNPVRWKINNVASAKLLKVMVGGYHAPDIQGIAANVPVEAFTYETPLCSKCTRAGGYFFAYDRNSAEFTRAEKMVRDVTGLQTINFQGAYKSNRFNVQGGDVPQNQGGAPEPFVGRGFEESGRGPTPNCQGRARLPKFPWLSVHRCVQAPSRDQRFIRSAELL